VCVCVCVMLCHVQAAFATASVVATTCCRFVSLRVQVVVFLFFVVERKVGQVKIDLMR